jgi:hypothetical protein
LAAGWESARPDNARPLCAAELSVDEDGLLVGTLTNETGVRLDDACLLHGRWGYRLGDLEPGKRVEIGPQLNAIQVKTLLARRAGRPAAGGVDGQTQDVFFADRASLDELLHVMMFYEAVGGRGFAGLSNRYQAYCDLSRLLDLDRAVLLATGTGRGSQWVDRQTGEMLASEQDSATVVYRFVIPVQTSSVVSGPLSVGARQSATTTTNN